MAIIELFADQLKEIEWTDLQQAFWSGDNRSIFDRISVFISLQADQCRDL